MKEVKFFSPEELKALAQKHQHEDDPYQKRFVDTLEEILNKSSGASFNFAGLVHWVISAQTQAMLSVDPDSQLQSIGQIVDAIIGEARSLKKS